MHVDPSLITLVQRHGKQIDVDETTIVDGFTSVSPILLPLDLGGYHSLTVARQSPFSIGITQATLIGALPFEFDDGTLVERSPRPGTFAIDRVTSEFPGRDGQTAFAEKPGAAVEIAGGRSRHRIHGFQIAARPRPCGGPTEIVDRPWFPPAEHLADDSFLTCPGWCCSS